MAKHLQELKEDKIMPIADFLMKISATAYSNKASLQKVKSNLNTVTQNVSRLDCRIAEAESHVQNNKAIISNFDDKLDKAILNTKQVAMGLSEACNKATSLKSQSTKGPFYRHPFNCSELQRYNQVIPHLGTYKALIAPDPIPVLS
eukprot:885594-Ditylum_brightwellii.AAC.1